MSTKNILIIAKIYHANGRARALQMRRVFFALQCFTDHNITLITEGKTDAYDNEIISIPPNKIFWPQIKRVFDRFLIETELLKSTNFNNEAYEKAKILIEAKKVDILFTVSSPIDSHLVGLSLKKQFPGLKWMTYFSDVWPFSLLPKPYYRKKFLSKKEEAITQKVILNCDMVITPSSFGVEILKSKYKCSTPMYSVPHCIEERAANSFDTDRSGYIVHSGDLQKERINSALVEAIIDLSLEEPNFKGFVHIGGYDNSLKILIEKFNCTHINLVGRLKEEEASKLQSKFSVGMIIESKMGDISPFMPSKITDSIQLHEKLICVTPRQSFLTQFSSEHKGVYSCVYNRDEIKKCVSEALKSKEIIEPETVQYFKPKKIAAMYDDLFEKLVIN